MNIRTYIREKYTRLAKEYTRLPGDWKRAKANRLRKSNLRKQKYREWKEKHKELIGYFRNLIEIYLLYGLIVNYVAWVLFGSSFTMLTPLAWGILAYIIKVELPFIIRDSKR